MVKNRGIEVSIISQFDIRRLPEFQRSTADVVEANAASRYVPIYAGSQFWFEYTIEPPHPPQAAYFFKLIIDNKCVTAWDCGEKHDYHGKMMYTLEKADVEPGYLGPPIQRKGFKFCNDQETQIIDEDLENGCMEIRVYRIEHRKRLREILPNRDSCPVLRQSSRLELTSGGFLEPGQPQRRYKYQLVDPLDEPYAVFRFFHRTYNYIWHNNIIAPLKASSHSRSSSLISGHDGYSASLEEDARIASLTDEGEVKTGRDHQSSLPMGPHIRNSIISNHSRMASDKSSEQVNLDTYLPLSDSDESLKIVARDSIEDLPSTVSRSLGSLRSRNRNLPEQCVRSPKKNAMSPRQKLKRALTLDLKSSGFGSDRERRPLSPFTNGGLLRRFMSPGPCNLTPAMTDSTESFSMDETPHSLNLAGSVSNRNASQTSYASRKNNDKSIMGYLSRKVSRKDTSDGSDTNTAKTLRTESRT